MKRSLQNLLSASQAYFVGSMGEVESGNVHAVLDHLHHLWHFTASGADRTDDASVSDGDRLRVDVQRAHVIQIGILHFLVLESLMLLVLLILGHFVMLSC